MAVVINGNGTVTGIAVGGLPDGIVDNGTMADDAIAIADLAATGTASSTTFLRGDNSWQAAGGAWTLLGTNTASNSASLNFETGISSTYTTYMLVWSDIVPVDNGESVGIRFGDSSGYDTGASDYSYARTQIHPTATAHYGDASSAYIALGYGSGSAANEGGCGVAYIHRSLTDIPPRVTFSSMGLDNLSSVLFRQVVGGGMRNTFITLDRLQVIIRTGNITSGTARLYGLANS